MNWIFLLILPTIASTAWVLYTKIKENKYYDLSLLALLALAVSSNAILMYQIILGNTAIILQMLQMVAAVSVIPLNYMYFARQVGTRMSNKPAIIQMWASTLLIFIPNIVLYNPFEPFVYPETGIIPFLIYFISHGEKVFSINTGDFATIVQTVIVVSRIVSLLLLLQRNNLHFNRKVYTLCAFWAVTIIFIIVLTSFAYEDLRTPLGMWFYYGFYSLLIITMNILIALHYDEYPIETEQGEVVEDVKVYVDHQFGAMAHSMRHMVKEGKLFLDPHFSTEQMIEKLGTNRTYFATMMTQEFGMTFSEYLSGLRFDAVKNMLKDTSLTMVDIATRCGFSDSNYMSRKFKERYGMTPSAWRKNNAE